MNLKWKKKRKKSSYSSRSHSCYCIMRWIDFISEICEPTAIYSVLILCVSVLLLLCVYFVVDPHKSDHYVHFSLTICSRISFNCVFLFTHTRFVLRIWKEKIDEVYFWMHMNCVLLEAVGCETNEVAILTGPKRNINKKKRRKEMKTENSCLWKRYVWLFLSISFRLWRACDHVKVQVFWCVKCAKWALARVR